MKTKSVRCEICKKRFDKPLNEYNRSKKLGRDFYCSRSCSGKAFVSHLKPYAGKYNNNLLPDNKRDEYSPFRSHLSRINRRFKEASVTLSDLKNVWEGQSGICVYTGVQLTQPKYIKENNPLTTASLDRIDSSKGYISGNIQFISMAANWAKNKMSHEQMLEFCSLIRRN